jgi:hypothetical protein
MDTEQRKTPATRRGFHVGTEEIARNPFGWKYLAATRLE